MRSSSENIRSKVVLGLLFGVIVIVGLARELAASAALLIRFCTLWFGVTLGFMVLALYRQQLFASQKLEAGGQMSEAGSQESGV